MSRPSPAPGGPNPAPELAVLDYGMGNLRSVLRAWEAVGARVRLVTDPRHLGHPDALVFPGQGAMPDCMQRLRDTGLAETLRQWIASDRPYFGICLGLQALFEHSEEGPTEGLGIWPGTVLRFRLPPEFKVPHMGWNSVNWRVRLPADAGFRSGVDQVYFVHSYHVQPADPTLVWGTTEYGGLEFVSGCARGRCWATQFHPEKSQAVGLQIYRGFLSSL